MRMLLRLLAPLIGLAMAAAGVLIVIEVIAAWLRRNVVTGLVVPWHHWRTAIENVTWEDPPVPGIAIAVAVLGLLLVLVGLLARRSHITLDGPAPEITVVTAPRVLARLIGRRVRATEDIFSASVTVSPRKVSVLAQAFDEARPELRDTVHGHVDEMLDELPLHRRPRVAVHLQERQGPR
ncbi:DUF6286 domain-containing protein [Pseudonocardia xinjiangensis]|uniref:DUF6286 domain-containing protein n=1 Tax=Pseudonocardia xinjiangensis TaxID=75289 RepID=UPI003D8F74EA